MDDDCKEYRRNKPQQKFYKPGSGPLRRSSYGLDGKSDHYGSQNSVNDDSLSETYNELLISRHKKPEQQLYVPRSGDTAFDGERQNKSSMRSDNSSQFNRKMSSRQEKSSFNSGTGSYPRGGPRRDRSYGEHQYKDGTTNDINYNRHYRQVSETRSISPTHNVQDRNIADRNRDSRSMETSAGRHSMAGSSGGGKPPSGRRNSAGYSSDTSRPKYMVNLDNIPPRFRKKILEQSGHHSFDSVDQINKDRHSNQSSYNQSQFYNSNLNWSQTLPSRGRGRLRDNEGFDREKFINSYLKNYEVQNSRRSTPSNSYMNLYEPNSVDNKSEKTDLMTSSVESQKDFCDNCEYIHFNSRLLWKC